MRQRVSRSLAKSRPTGAGTRSARTTPQSSGRALAPKQGIVTAVDRASRLLLALTQASDFLSLPEIARRAGLSKPTAFRLLTTLATEDLVFHNEANGTYGLGHLTLRMADAVLGSIPARESTRAAMGHIRDQVNETVVLSIRQDDVCYHVDSIESTQSIGRTHLMGVPVPLHSVAAGRAMLAALTEEQLTVPLGGIVARWAPGAKVEREKLRRELERVRARGYAVSSTQFPEGGHTIACAIPDATGAAFAALHISFPLGRFTKERELRCLDALKRGVQSLQET
jgi:DNA-binding IclR family transcriptional regulator